ncbi:MAG: hypothetical protein ABSD30_08615 [Candidatus Binatus sp.]|jgi:hypothetical protein
MSTTRHGVRGLAIAIVILSWMPASDRLAFAGQIDAYDEAPPNAYSDGHAALETHRAELMRIPGVSLVYLANDGNIVVRVRELTPEIDEQIPRQLDGCPVKVVSVEDVMRRHQHELEAIAGEDQVYGFDVESFPGGQLAIVVRVARPDFQQPMKVPTNIEGIPLRVLVAQDPLTN